MTSAAQDKARLQILAGIADRSNGDRWQVEHDDAGMHLVALRSNAGRAILCTIHSQASPDEVELLTGALDTLYLLFRTRRRSKIAYEDLQRQLAGPQNLKDGDFAAEAAMLCARPEFHRFLERRDGSQKHPIHTADEADKSMKRLLGITSKKQLMKEERAQQAFFAMRSDLKKWEGQGQSRR
ncbi:hypothetical protein ASF91_19570 [Rhizobium sp. Leaf155]|nr:hypothetical protein ASF91_19570 [Rhizobium sp. Leaf155]